jgi:four helix bundle protein
MKHQDSRIYRRALELIALSTRVIERLPRGKGKLADQIDRSARSVLSNFSEGCGRSSVEERRYFFDVARASARETASHFDGAHASGHVHEHDRDAACAIADHLANMLSRWR